MSRVTQKYQATIPKEVRRKLSIKPGDRVVFFEDTPNRFVVMRQDDFIEEVAKLCRDIGKTVKESREGFGRSLKT